MITNSVGCVCMNALTVSVFLQLRCVIKLQLTFKVILVSVLVYYLEFLRSDGVNSVNSLVDFAVQHPTLHIPETE